MQNKVYLLFGLDKIKSSQAQYDSKLLLSFDSNCCVPTFYKITELGCLIRFLTWGWTWKKVTKIKIETFARCKAFWRVLISKGSHKYFLVTLRILLKTSFLDFQNTLKAASNFILRWTLSQAISWSFSRKAKASICRTPLDKYFYI